MTELLGANMLRMSILEELSRGPMTTHALRRRFPEAGRQAILRHLCALEECGAVYADIPTGERRSQKVTWSMNSVCVTSTIRNYLELLENPSSN